MIIEYEEGGYSIAALARRYGVSRKTACKWIGRYGEESWEGLQDRSRAPHEQARATGTEIVERVLELKARWPLWGAPKLHFKLKEELGESGSPSEATVSNILHRHGLTKAPRRRRVAHGPVPAAYGHVCNEVWCADFKGWWLTGDGRRCQPLTITDASSRYLLRCEGLSKSTATAAVRAVFTATFREYGLPAAMRTDNGPPFASNGLAGLSVLSVWWLKLGIGLDRIEPGHPEQNGRHERMHRTLKENIGGAARHLSAEQAKLARFREHYNHERPHEALAFAVPGACYEPSRREWSEKRIAPMEYADDWESRAVRGCGQMGWRGRDIRVSRALVGERVGLKPAGDGRWEVFFGGYALGTFDERKGRIEVPRRRAAKTEGPPVTHGVAETHPRSTSLRSVRPG
jgi:transposase InsO family protein